MHMTETLPPAAPPLAPAACAMALVRRARTGDATAFEEIMRRHNRLLFRSARGIVPDDAQAQDVVQEAYLQAFTHLHAFRGESALGTWLVRITIRVALQALRRKGQWVQLEDGWDSGDMACAEITMPNQFQAPESPDLAAERGELRAVLQAAIADLPVIYRSVFMLRAVENMSVSEVADCLGVSEAVVKTRFLRARALLRDTLVDQFQIHAPTAFAFAGARCDAVVLHVLAGLRARGLVQQA
ncbi:RNA polymerase sigma factor [Comamonadaceae bacterium G21597-S1]|nr:RNA polymerase sigma factor [Comamonadaceae bacterium G21597-S1]